MTEKRRRVCLGAFAGAHGVKGDALLKTFTEAPQNIALYGSVETEDGARAFTLRFIRNAKPGFAIVGAPEIASREDADALKGVRIFVDRAALPNPDEDEFYLDDLVGLDAVDEEGARAGRVAAVHNFGAGDILELENIPGVKGARMIPFTSETVPTVDIGNGSVTILRAAIEDMDATADEDGAAAGRKDA